MFISRYDNSKIAIWWRSLDKLILFLSLSLLLIGISLNFLSTSTIPSEKLYESRYILFYKHFFFSVTGLAILLSFSFFDNEKIKKIGLIFFFIFGISLILVHFIGVDVKGSRRWLNLFFFRVQPIEFVKPFLILIIALILNKEKISIKLRFFITIPVILSIIILLLAQPDYGQSLLIITIWMIMIFVSGISLFFITSAGLIILGSMVFVLFLFKEKFFYIFDRLISWSSSLKISYQSEQALNAIMSGGFFGKGIGEGILKEKVPEAHTDYVMSVIAEEYGIILIALIILVLLFLIIRIFISANNSNDIFNKTILIGLGCLLIVQSYINLGVTINILPSTGMPFPFVSYGGSSIVGSCFIIGIILSITRKQL